MALSQRIFHHGLDSVPFKDNDPQHTADGITHSVQNILDQNGKKERNSIISTI